MNAESSALMLNGKILDYKRIYPFSHSPIKCLFSPSARDFVVTEVPLYAPDMDKNAEHLMLYVRKKGLSTQEMLDILSSALGIKAREIGYAGLKDKAAMTYQYLSIHRSLQDRLDSALDLLESKQIKVLNIAPHSNKLKLGHLKGNSFFARFKKISKEEAKRLILVLESIRQSGFPNYFGAQRFGKDGNNATFGQNLAYKKAKIANKKLSNFLISSYQSALFNAWLNARIKLSQILHHFSAKEALEALSGIDIFSDIATTLDSIKALQKQSHIFKLLPGDIMCHYPFGKAFVCDDIGLESSRFSAQNIAPTGALSGLKCLKAQNLAAIIETQFLDSRLKAIGERRYAWVWASEISYRYIEAQAHFELHFYLPKGCYGTTFLEALLGG